MVLETIDTTFNTVGDVNTDTPKEDLLSPLSICTQAITPKPDVREDTALSTPCESITNYANELAASNSRENFDDEQEAVAAGEEGVVPPEAAPEQRDQPQELAATDSVEIVASKEEPTLQATEDDAKPAEVAIESEEEDTKDDSVEVPLEDTEPAIGEEEVSKKKMLKIKKLLKPPSPFTMKLSKDRSKKEPAPADDIDNTEEVVQEQMETIDLTPKAADNKEHACSDFIVEQNDSMQVKEAEMADALQLETTTSKELANDDESLVEVQVGKSQITELVSKTPEEKAAEIADAAAKLPPKVEEPSDADSPNMIETIYSKVEGCFGDVTNMCGPKSNPGKEDKKDKEEDELASFLPKELTVTERVTSFIDEITNNESFRSLTDGITDAIFPKHKSTESSKTPATETYAAPLAEEKDVSTYVPPVNGNAEENETVEAVTTDKSIPTPTPVKNKKRLAFPKLLRKKKSSTAKETVTPAAEEPAPVVEEAKETIVVEEIEVVEKEETIPAEAKDDATDMKPEEKNKKPKLSRLSLSTKSIPSPIKILSPKSSKVATSSEGPTSPDRLSQLKRGLTKSKVTASKTASKSAQDVKKVAQTCVEKAKMIKKNRMKGTKSLMIRKKNAVVEEPEEADVSSEPTADPKVDVESPPVEESTDESPAESQAEPKPEESVESQPDQAPEAEAEAVVEDSPESSTVESASPEAESNTDVPPAEEQTSSETSTDESPAEPNPEESVEESKPEQAPEAEAEAVVEDSKILAPEAKEGEPKAIAPEAEEEEPKAEE